MTRNFTTFGELADTLDSLEEDGKGLQFTFAGETYTLVYMDDLQAICEEPDYDFADEDEDIFAAVLGPVPYDRSSTLVTLIDEEGEESAPVDLSKIVFKVTDC
jgi:hypothetical protein